jgi:hypothetical protein
MPQEGVTFSPQMLQQQLGRAETMRPGAARAAGDVQNLSHGSRLRFRHPHSTAPMALAIEPETGD